MMCVDIMRPPEIAADRIEHGKLPPQHIPVVFYSVWVSHEKWSIWSNLPHLWKIGVLQVNVTLSYSLLWHPECWRGTWGWVPAQPGPSSPCVNSRLTAPSLWEVCFACWPDANAQLKGSVPDFIRGLGDMCQVPAAHTSYQPSIQSQLKDPLWHHTDPSGLGWMPGSLLATNLPSCGLEASPLLPDVTCLKGLHLNHLQATRASEHNLSSNNINQGSVIWGEWDLASHPVRCRRAGKYDSEEGVGYLLSCKVREQAKKCMARTQVGVSTSFPTTWVKSSSRMHLPGPAGPELWRSAAITLLSVDPRQRARSQTVAPYSRGSKATPWLRVGFSKPAEQLGGSLMAWLWHQVGVCEQPGSHQFSPLVSLLLLGIRCQENRRNLKN